MSSNTNPDKPEIHISFSSTNTGQLVSNGYQNSLKTTCPYGSYNLRDYEACLKSLNIYFSFPSIKQNTPFNIIWPATSSSPAVTLTINVPVNTYYTIAQLNALIQFTLLNNGYYIVDPTGNIVYYVQLVVNSTTYKVDIQCPQIPTSLPASYTNPAGMVFPLVASNAQLVVQNNAFATVTGISAGTYPTTPTITSGNYSGEGQVAPEICPYSSIYVWLDCCNNTQFTWPEQINSFSVGSTPYGATISVEPKVFTFSKTKDTDVRSITIKLYDQTGSPINVLDSSWSADVILRPIDRTNQEILKALKELNDKLDGKR